MKETSTRPMFIIFVTTASLALTLLLFPTIATAQGSSVGSWEAPVQLQVDGVHGAVLPSGKVLYVPHRANPDGSTESVVFDPSNPSGAKYVPIKYNFFCGGHSFMSDGKLLFNGGETFDDGALRSAGYFDYVTENWTVVAQMNNPRWYPSTIQLGDGSLWTFGGQTYPADAGSNDDTIEIYDPATNTWVMAGGQDIPGQYTEAYNRLHLLPDGKIFQSGHLPDTYLYDPVATTWTFVDTTNLNRPRGNGSSVLLQDGRILLIGGEDKVNYFDSVEVIDLSQPMPQWQNVASLNTARAFINATVLPDGKVLVLGGDEAVGSASLVPELYDPVANTWTNMAAFQIERGYHATSLLLPDGRVIISGGEGHDGPGVFGESAKFEIWSPPYLFGTARPVINTLPATAGYGEQVTMNFTSSVTASHVVIHRGGSQTHSFSYNQISIPVNFDSNNGSTATFTIPNNPNLLPPTYYMIFLMSSDGVPSEAKFIQIGATSGGLFSDGFESGNTSAWSSVGG